jgi:proteasome lid subunit RPN8/RPN11
MDRVRVAPDVLAAIESHARAEAPRECCGLLLGTLPPASTWPEIHRAEPTRNLAIRPTRYDIDPADHFRILRDARRSGLAVLGAYHSHPASPPVPSPTDLAEALSDFLYIIATLLPSADPVDERIRAYIRDGETLREIRLVLLEKPTTGPS